MGIDYLESLFTGMDIIIDKRLKELSFDKTIVCTVVNNEKKKNGEYRVSDGAIEFIAYSDSNKYQVNDQVLVKIPQGDYTEKKFIEGRYVNDNNTSPITYISPLDTIVNISGNLVDNNNIQYGIVANSKNEENYQKPVYEEKVIWAKGFVEEPLSKITGDGIYDTITLRANFKTLLNDYHLYEGRYGLKLEIYTKASKDSNTLFLNTVILDSSEMFGNPYMFSVYSRQEKSFLINTEGYIHALKLILYQDGKFRDILTNRLIPKNEISDNVLVKDIELGIGSDLTKVSDNTLKLYTISDPQYKYYGWLPETNDKQLGLLWYNKDDNNKFLGFSDGVYDKDYDEKEYLERMRADRRLEAQLGRPEIPTDKISLTLAANIEEGSQGVIQAKNLITKDVYQELTNFLLYLNETLKIEVSDFYDNLNNIGEQITIHLDAIKSYYKEVLKWDYENRETEFPNLDPEHSLSNLKQIFIDFRKDGNELLKNLLDLINSENGLYKGYQGIYDTYEIRLNRIFDKIIKFDNEDEIIDDIISKLVFFDDEETLKNYPERVKEEYLSSGDKDNNKYAIYWYRYDKTAPGDEFMPSGWEYLKEFADFGLPDSDEETGFHQVALPAGTYNTITMRHDQQEEKFVVVLFYNHVMYKSNELVFTNADEVPDKATLDMSDALLIEHLDNSYDNYYIYNLTNNLNNIADKSIHRQIRCHYDGLFDKDNVLTDGEIYWYVPNNDNSMLTVDDGFLKGKGFSTDKNGKTSLSINGYDYYYKKIGKIIEDKNNPGGYISVDDKDNLISIDYRDFWYMIKPYYSHTAKNNNIICKVKLNGKDEYLQASVLLSFGIEGTSGTHYTLVITNSEPNRVSTIPTQDNEDIFNGSLKLNISVRDYENEKIPIIKGNGTNGSNAFLTDSNIDWLFSLSKNKDFNLISITDTNEVVGINIATNKCGILKTIVGLSNPDQDGKFMDLTSLYPVPYSNNPDYYISGPTHIIYNSFGTLDNMSMFNQKYKLWSYSDNSEIKNITWKIEYYTEDGIIDDSTDEKLKTFYENYMPKLSEDKLIPAPMYLDKIEEECWAVVKAIRESDTLWLQPIIILQNRYASSLLNDWDGSFQIDEENGTILSTMIGAGRKTDDNTFSGVLMGEVGAAAGIETPPHKTGLGIYGFNDGAQSFGLNIDGTAFFGKAARGRIEIDGNNSTITSRNYLNGDTGIFMDLDKPEFIIRGSKQNLIHINNNTYYLQTNDYKSGTSGLRINLEEGKIDAYSFSLNAGTEEGKIQLNSSPKVGEYYLNIGNSNSYINFDNNGNLKINAQNFNLKGTISSGLYKDSFIQLLCDNNNPSFNFYLKEWDTEENLNMVYSIDMMKISPSEFLLQSKDWSFITTDSGESDDETEGGEGEENNPSETVITFVKALGNIRLRNEMSGSSDDSIIGSSISGQYYYVYSISELNEDGSCWVKLSNTRNIYSYASDSNYAKFNVSSLKGVVNDSAGLNVRNQPSTSGTIISTLAYNKSMTVYKSEFDSNYDLWYKISSSEEKWVFAAYVDITTPINSLNVITEESQALSQVNTGMQIDIKSGLVVMNKNTTQSIYIDSKHTTHPLQIGVLSNGLRNFRVGWDGSIAGGTTYNWSISKAGTATFGKINAKSGTFSGNISGSNISGSNISGSGITGGSIKGTTISGTTFYSGDLTISGGRISFGDSISLYLNNGRCYINGNFQVASSKSAYFGKIYILDSNYTEGHISLSEYIKYVMNAI